MTVHIFVTAERLRAIVMETHAQKVPNLQKFKAEKDLITMEKRLFSHRQSRMQGDMPKSTHVLISLFTIV